MRTSRLHQEKNNRIEKEKGDEKGKDGDQQDVGGSQVLLLQLLLLLVLLACWVWPGMKEILQGREIIMTKWVIKRKDLRRKRSARPRPKMTQGKRRKDRSTVKCSSSISNTWRYIIRSMFPFQFQGDRQVRDERQDRQIWHLNLTFQVNFVYGSFRNSCDVLTFHLLSGS